MTDILISILVLLTFPGACYLLLITTLAGVALYRTSSPESSLKGASKPLNICVLIPAYNEELGLEDTLIQLRSCSPNRGSFEIWVVADNCTDNTEELARRQGCKVLRRENIENIGKSHALEYAFNHLTTKEFDVFVVIDADTSCQKNMLLEVETAFSRGLDAAQLVNTIKADNNPYSILTALGFTAMNLLRPRARKQLGLSCGIFGTGFALSSRVLNQCPYTTHSIVEDAQYHIQLITNGFRSELLETSRVYSGVPKYDEGAQAQRNRWEGGRFRLLKDSFFPLVGKIIGGKWRLIDPLAEMLLMPLSYYLIATLLLTSLSFDTPLLLSFCLFNLLILVAHFLLAIKHSDTDQSILQILTMVPGYLVWKVKILTGSIRKSRRDSSWVRTQRK